MAVVAFAGSRSLAGQQLAIVATLVQGYLARGSSIRVGCAVGVDAAVINQVLLAKAESRLEVFAAFGQNGAGAWSGSSANIVKLAAHLGARVNWFSGGGEHVSLTTRLASRTIAMVQSKGLSGLVCVFGSEQSRGTRLAAKSAAAVGVPVVAVCVGFEGAPPIIGAGEWVSCKVGHVQGWKWQFFPTLQFDDDLHPYEDGLESYTRSHHYTPQVPVGTTGLNQWVKVPGNTYPMREQLTQIANRGKARLQFEDGKAVWYVRSDVYVAITMLIRRTEEQRASTWTPSSDTPIEHIEFDTLTDRQGVPITRERTNPDTGETWKQRVLKPISMNDRLYLNPDDVPVESDDIRERAEQKANAEEWMRKSERQERKRLKISATKKVERRLEKSSQYFTREEWRLVRDEIDALIRDRMPEPQEIRTQLDEERGFGSGARHTTVRAETAWMEAAQALARANDTLNQARKIAGFKIATPLMVRLIPISQVMRIVNSTFVLLVHTVKQYKRFEKIADDLERQAVEIERSERSSWELRTHEEIEIKLNGDTEAREYAITAHQSKLTEQMLDAQWLAGIERRLSEVTDPQVIRSLQARAAWLRSRLSK